MDIVSYILLGIMLGAVPMLAFAQSAAVARIRLTKGLAVSGIAGLAMAAMVLAGILLGNILRMADEYAVFNDSVFLAFMAVVGVRLMVQAFRKKEAVAYDISRGSTAVVLCIVLAINGLLVGMGLGFLESDEKMWRAAAIVGGVALVVVTSASYLGIMFGRQQTKLKSRRWLLTAVLLLASAALLRMI
ncbi:MAG: manganese efflux pump [Bacteroidales bacterium]|nr:manganese efflux pump [Bacteroidales bacterium]